MHRVQIVSSASPFPAAASDKKNALLSHRILVGVIAGIGLIAIAGAFMIFAKIDTLMERNAAAASDNRTWVLAQLEVDLVKLTSAVVEARIAAGTPGVLDAVRTQFDILYSRIALIENSSVLQDSPLHQSREWKNLVGADGLMQAWVPVIDGPDRALRDALPLLHHDFGALRQGIRLYVVDSVFSVISQGDLMRLSLRETLRAFAAVTYGLLFGLFGLMIWLYFQSRSRALHARKLELALQNLRMTISAAPDAVLIADARGTVIAANNAARDLLGPGIGARKPVAEVFRTDPSCTDALCFKELQPGQRHRRKAMRQNGTQFEAEVSVGQGRTEFDELITVIFLRDISEQIAYEQTLAQARNDAMAADEAKARFLTVMNHEMRTPLNGLLSAADLLLHNNRLERDQNWLVDIIRTCGQATLEQVNNVLLLARMSNADGGDHPAGPVRLSRFLSEIAKQFTADAMRAGNSLTLIGTDAPSSVVLLPQPLLRRAVGNLLSNAVKFTTNGNICVELAETPARDAGRVAIRITVSDTGIGIAAADIDRIFRNFETLDVSYARVREGSGLGLGIAKLSIEEIGGRIETQSEPGKGSRFSLIFEAALTDRRPDDDVAPPGSDDLNETTLRGISVLVADDNLLNRTLMGKQLENLGAHVVLASDGAEAVEMARHTAFDVILMDISMPVVDGLQATRIIRKAGASRAVPVIAITAQASPIRTSEFRSAGMQDVLTKPARVADLVGAIRALVPRDPTHNGGPAAAGDTQAVAPGFAALVADLGPEFMAQMADCFRSDTEAALTAARRACDDGDLDALRGIVHSAAGAAGVIGLEALAAVLRAVEDNASAGRADPACALLAEAAAVFARDIGLLRPWSGPGDAGPAGGH